MNPFVSENTVYDDLGKFDIALAAPIEAKVPQNERLVRLNNSARRQMKVLKDNKNIKDLELLQKQVNEDNNLIAN